MSRERQSLPVQPGRRELPDLCPYCEKPVLENTYVGKVKVHEDCYGEHVGPWDLPLTEDRWDQE